jgi:lipopolysaccharide export system protein LptA
LVQIDKHGKVTPIAITSARLTYTDDQHRAHFEGGVTARGADATIAADHLDAFLVPRGQGSQNTTAKGPGQLERIVAEGNVSIQEPARRANGDRLTFTTAEDKFVLTGGTPSIFDAEHGKITGDSLTFFRRDDRVLVEGKDNSPTVTQTRVAR